MPECCECEHCADVLRDELKGWSITEMDYTDLFKKNKQTIDTELVETSLPLYMKEVAARAKRIIFLVTDSEGEETAFCWFFAMVGRLSFTEGKYTQLSMTFSKGKEQKILYYQDSRTIGFAKYITTGDELRAIFKNIGADYLKGEVTETMFMEAIHNKRRAQTLIANFLLAQTPFAGIGNWIRSECLWRARLSPYRTLESLSDRAITRLYTAIMDTIIEGYKHGGLTIDSYNDPLGRRGEYRARVYGQKEDEEGNPVTHEKFGPPPPKGKPDSRRSVWYAKAIQR